MNLDRFKFRIFALTDKASISHKGKMYYDPIKPIDQYFSEMEKGDVVILQSTGLKDKNGELIYEGDVIKIDNKLYYIEYQENGAWFRVIGIKFEHRLVLDTWVSQDCEIIGNIYENPELLTV